MPRETFSAADNAGFLYGENWATSTLTFAPTVTELGAMLRFVGTVVVHSGYYLDNVSMAGVGTPTQPPAAGVVAEGVAAEWDCGGGRF